MRQVMYWVDRSCFVANLPHKRQMLHDSSITVTCTFQEIRTILAPINVFITVMSWLARWHLWWALTGLIKFGNTLLSLQFDLTPLRCSPTDALVNRLRLLHCSQNSMFNESFVTHWDSNKITNILHEIFWNVISKMETEMKKIGFDFTDVRFLGPRQIISNDWAPSRYLY